MEGEITTLSIQFAGLTPEYTEKILNHRCLLTIIVKIFTANKF